MTEAHPGRRAILAGLAAAFPCAAAQAQAAPGGRPWAAGALAGNSVARFFQAAPPGMKLPELTLLGPRGPQRLSELRGRTLLIPLWAEWCAPCIVEMPDMAALQARHGGPSFAITPILTGSAKKLDVAGAGQIMAKVKAGGLGPLIEPAGGAVLYRTLTTRQDEPSAGRPTLPCNLLVDPRGRVVARQFGGIGVGSFTRKVLPAGSKPPAPGTVITRRVLTEAEKREMMAGAESGGSKTIWSTPDAHAFAAALARGLLDRI